MKMNGASYLDNQRPIILNPVETLRANTSKADIQFLLHESVLDNAMKTYFEKNSRNFSIDLSTVSGLLDVNSQTMGALFPSQASE